MNLTSITCRPTDVGILCIVCSNLWYYLDLALTLIDFCVTLTLAESRSVPSQSVKKQISMVETERPGGQGGGAVPPPPLSGKTPKEKSAFSFVSDVFKSKSKEKVRNISK